MLVRNGFLLGMKLFWTFLELGVLLGNGFGSLRKAMLSVSWLGAGTAAFPLSFSL